jgi:hypothetical protein
VPLTTDPSRAGEVGEALYQAFHGSGLLGDVSVPEHLLPAGVERGSPEQLHFITLTVAIAHAGDADALWKAGRQTYADPETRYLYSPRQVVRSGIDKLTADLCRHGLAQRPEQDIGVWQTICVTLARHFDGDVFRLLQQAGFQAPRLLATVQNPRYHFPCLKEDGVALRWVCMLEQSWQGYHLTGLAALPLQVDLHIAAASVMTGCVRGPFSGPLDELMSAVAQLWAEACRDGPRYALALGQPLALLSRRGCRNTPTFPCVHRRNCPVRWSCCSTELRVDSAAGGSEGAVELLVHRPRSGG